MGDRGRTNINEDREVFNLPPIPGGDRQFIRGEYRPVDSYGESLDPVEPISGTPPVDKSVSGGIIETRKFIQNPDTGKMEGSTSDGGHDSGSGETSKETNASIDNVTGKTATIDKRKFTEYALNPEKQPDKARAFKEYLGYDLSNYDELEQQIRNTFDREKLQENGERAQGKLYKRLVELQGPNGKTANVMTSWIDDVNDKKDFHLTSIYVKE